MPVNLFTHLKSDSTRCRAIALAGRRLCRFHAREQQRAKRRHAYAVSARNRGRYIRLGSLATPRAIRLALTRVLQSVSTGTLDLHRAGPLLNRIEAASGKLNRAGH